ncbi:MAG: Ig-like domain-containing protein, partial [Bacteroidota bacterium]
MFHSDSPDATEGKERAHAEAMPPGSDFSFDCDDGKKVDLYGTGGKCETNPSVDIPNSGNVYQAYVEIVYKGANPGNQVIVRAGGRSHVISKVSLTGTSSSVHVFRGQINGSVSQVSFPNPPNRCNLQSILVYAFRQGVASTGQSGIFTAFSGYRDSRTFSIPIPAGIAPRDIDVRVPLSEITTDCRILNVYASAGSISNSVQVSQPDPDLGGCCLSIPVIRLENVPADITSIDITVESPVGSRNGCPVGPNQNGQSYVVAGLVMADVECILCIDPIASDDNYSTCPNQAINGNVSDNDRRISDQNHRYSLRSAPARGRLDLNPDGRFNYVPEDDFCGNLSFRYKICNDGVDAPACCDEATAHLIINDTEAPRLLNIPNDLTVSCEAVPAPSNNVRATDNCSNNLTVHFSQSDDQQNTGCGEFDYTISRTWRVEDICGNETVRTQTLHVKDLQAPVASGLPPDLTVSCNDLPAVDAPTFADDCDNNFRVDFSEVQNDGLCQGNYTLIRKWTATDLCNNSRVVEQLITVQDVVAPSLADPADLTISCEQAIPAPQLPSASDNCIDSADLRVVLESETSNQTNNGSCTDFNYIITRIYKATDPCGNASQQVQQIEIVDDQAPILSSQASNLTVECDGSGNTSDLSDWLNNQGGAQASDNCSALRWTHDFSGLSDDCGATGRAEVTFTATDACGNSVQTSAEFIILDRIAPQAICKDIRVQLDANAQLILQPADVDGGSNDACGAVILNAVQPNAFDLSNLGDNQVQLTLEDECGNPADCRATVRIESFDLALRKRLADAEADRRVYPGQIITFAIEVYNQGTLDATNIEILDYIPNGLSLADADWNNNANGTASFTISSLAAGASTTVEVSLRVEQRSVGIIRNRAEIFKANAPAGFGPIDVDSRFDGNPSNDAEVDNVIDNTGGDEDDADFEEIQVEIFDLALQKNLDAAASDAPIIQDRKVVFNIRIFNQGSVAATGIRLIDYVPTGLRLDDANWTDNGDGTAAYNTPLQLAPGQDLSIPIAFVVELGVEGQLLNFAEISAAKDDLGDAVEDLDSTPDTNNGNDTLVDNEINNAGGDQDDHDVEAVLVERFDLALIKQFDAANSANPILQGREVTFNLRVLNQGSIPASNIQLVDYLPNGLELADANWQDNGDGTASLRQPFDLAVGQNQTIPIRLRVKNGVTGNLVNRAEIADARDVNGRPALDIDSTPDAVQGNDTGGQVNTTDDDNASGNGKQGEDEDDEDPEDITVETFDLALRKRANFNGTQRAGTDVTFVIDIFNQGSIPARNIRINEFLPTGFALSNNDPNNWQQITASQLQKTIATPLLPGTQTSVEVVLTIQPDTRAGDYTNKSEISAATDNNGLAAADIDATYDDNPNNDRLVDDEINDNGQVDEDDHDIAIASVCDIIPPVLAGIPADVTLECTEVIPNPPVLYSELTASDESDPTVQISFSEQSTQGQGANCTAYDYTITRTWIATDICNNTSSAQQIIQVQDTQAPVISVEASDRTVECDGGGNGLELRAWLDANGGATATDACGDNAVFWSNDFTAFSDDCGASGQAIVTFTVRDDCGNTAQTTATFTIVDRTAPQIVTPAQNLSVECDGQGNQINIDNWLNSQGGALATDLCSSNNIQWTNDFNGLSDDCGDTGSTRVTFTATDDCGNQSRTTATFTIVDTSPPSIGIVAKDLIVECDGNGNQTELNEWLNTQGGAGAIDLCSDISWQNDYAQLSNDCGASGSALVTFTVSDACGNTSQTTARFTVLDRSNPVLQGVPADATVECDAVPSPAAVTATDVCDAAVVVDFQEVRTDGNCPDAYVLTRTWTATDACGNQDRKSQRIAVEDKQAPSLQGIPADVIVACESVPSAASPTATDNCDLDVDIQYLETRISGSCPDSYRLIREWTATDNCGNQQTRTQTITVQDLEAPILSGVPANVTVSCESVPAPASPSATDNCDADVTLQFVENIVAGNCTDSYSIVRTWLVTDNCGNNDAQSQLITVVDDTKPVLAGVPADITVACDAVPTAANPSATDNCDANVDIQYLETRIPGFCPDTYRLVRQWTATDNCGNRDVKTQEISVRDQTAPLLSGVPADATVECDAVPSPASPTVSDNCDADVTLQFVETRVDGACPDAYSLVRTWLATDNCGNNISRSQLIVVEDQTPPVLSDVPANITVECDAVPAAAAVSATDNCDADVRIDFVEVRTDGDCPDAYTLRRTWTATDDCGNATEQTQLIQVEDKEKPQLIGIPADITVECSDIPTAASPSVSDNCDVDVDIQLQEVRTDGDCPDSYVLNRIWTATDNCGNLDIQTQQITVLDRSQPTLVGVPADVTVECDAVPAPAQPTASDNCDVNPSIEFTEIREDGDCPNSYRLIRSWTATDDCGNRDAKTQVLVVEDRQAPILSGVPANATVECDAVPTPAQPTASDNCDADVSIQYTEVRTDGNCPNSYTLTRTWTATDDCGNQEEQIQEITVLDRTRPVLSGVPADLTLECDAIPAPAQPTATDNCDTDVSITYQEVREDGQCVHTYILQRTWTATDDCGNASTQTQRIVVQDETAPSLAGVPANVTVEC